MKKWWNQFINKTKEIQNEKGMREKAVKALAGFLTVMLFFTLLSRGANAVTIPKVSAGTAEKKTITDKVTAPGYFTANKEVPVTVEGGILIRSVEAGKGNKIKKGDILMRLDMDDLEERIVEEELEIEKLRLAIADAGKNRGIEQQQKAREASRAREDYNEAVKRGNEEVNQARKNMDDTKKQLEDLKKNKPEKKSADQIDEEENDGYDYKAELKAWKEEVSQLKSIYNEKKELYKTAQNSKKDNMKENKRKEEDANVSPQADSTKEQLEKEKELKEKGLKKLKKLKKKKGIVKSDVEGTVTEAVAVTGDITPDTKSFLISDDGGGIKFTAQITKEEQKNISTGEEVSVALSNGDEIEGLQIESIIANEEDPQIMEIDVILEARDDIHLMDQGDMNIEKSSQAYSTCVPVEALREDSGGKYLLILQEKETALGTELEAVRQPVEVIDKNNKYAALEDGIITDEQKFIVDSDKAVEAGDMVRLLEE